MKSSKCQSQRGGILTEFSLVLPVIVTIFMGFMELGTVLDQRARVERSLYEAVRYGMSLPGLEEGTVSSAAVQQAKTPKQFDLHTRIGSILKANQIRSEVKVTVSSELKNTFVGAQKTGMLTVSAEMEIPATFLSFFTRSYKIRLSQTGAYLFRF